MKFFCLFSFVVVVSMALAMPTVGNVEVVQGADRVVKVSYDLSGGPAIITFDVTTNGVSLGDRAFDRAWGAVNSLVTNETGRLTFMWLPENEITADVIAGGASVDIHAWSPDSPPDYIVFDMVAKNTINYYPSVGRLPGGIGSDAYRKEKLVMRKIPAAGVRWQMGSPDWQKGRTATAASETLRNVTLSEDYYIAVFEFTQGQYLNFYKSNITGATLPDGSDAACNTSVDHDLCPISYITRANLRGAAASGYAWPGDGHTVHTGFLIGKLRTWTGFDFDLPTHAQWEYACRAGQSAALYTGHELHTNDDSDNAVDASLTNVAWYAKNQYLAQNKKAPVGLLAPNAWGLYDTLGNVWEYALDRHSDATRPSTDVTDPTGPSSGSNFKQAGSSYAQKLTYTRCAYSRGVGESSNGNDYGFRLCCPVNKTWKVPVVAAE